MDNRRISDETFNNFDRALHDIIYEYLHSFRTEENKTKVLNPEAVNQLRKHFMDYMGMSLDMAGKLLSATQHLNP